MRNFIISFLFVTFSFFISQAEAADCSGKTSAGRDMGFFCTLIDGPITCIVVDGNFGGGIDCTANSKDADLSVFIGSEDAKYSSVLSGTRLTRKLVGNRVCYFYDGNKSNGVSCLVVKGTSSCFLLGCNKK